MSGENDCCRNRLLFPWVISMNLFLTGFSVTITTMIAIVIKPAKPGRTHFERFLKLLLIEKYKIYTEVMPITIFDESSRIIMMKNNNMIMTRGLFFKGTD